MSYLSRYGRNNLVHSRAQFKFSIFLGQLRCRPTQAVLEFYCALQWRRIRFYGLRVHEPASITELGYFQVNLTSWPTWQAQCFRPTLWAGGLQLACLSESAYSVRAQQNTLSLCHLNSYQQPFKSRTLGCSSIGPGWSAAEPAPGRPASRWTSASTRSMLISWPAAGDVMAARGAGGAAGPAPDVRHQPPGTTIDIY